MTEGDQPRELVSRTYVACRLVALAVALVAAWPASAEHPRRGYVFLAPSSAAPALTRAEPTHSIVALFDRFGASTVALPVALDVRIAVASASRGRDAASPDGYRAPCRSRFAGRGPPLDS